MVVGGGGAAAAAAAHRDGARQHPLQFHEGRHVVVVVVVVVVARGGGGAGARHLRGHFLFQAEREGLEGLCGRTGGDQQGGRRGRQVRKWKEMVYL